MEIQEYGGVSLDDRMKWIADMKHGRKVEEVKRDSISRFYPLGKDKDSDYENDWDINNY